MLDALEEDLGLSDDGAVTPASSRARRPVVVSDVDVPRMAVGDRSGSHGRVAVPVVNIADDDSEVWTGSLENIEGTPRDNGGSTTEEVEDWGSAASEAGSHIAEEESTPDVFNAEEARMTGHNVSAAFQSLDQVDLERIFQRRACVMRSVPRILNGPFRVALRIAVQEILDCVTSRDVARQVRGWKVLFLLPRMLL